VDGKIVVRDMMNLSLSLDHRVVDGAIGAQFMRYIIPLIENPALLLLIQVN
jgi:pyruvate dehydrogenase E2 component (dihydrolipoamide acetyltransferase)